MIKDGMDDFIVPVDDNDYAVVRKAHVFHFLIMAGIIGCMFKKVFEESGQLFFFAEIRVYVIAIKACNGQHHPLIIIAFICDVICSYIGLLALLLMMISITYRLFYYSVLNAQVHYNIYILIVNS